MERNRVILFVFELTFILCLSVFGVAQEKAAEVSDLSTLSLEELMQVNISAGTITGSPLSKAPISITTITSQDIEMAPARNIYDLLEIYVPGLIYMFHAEGFHPYMRGIVSDRDYKFLLVVNGKVMNQRAHNGAVSELGNWDLGDIEKIEVVRGPGSVTYGPGAIMGVVNITTKSAKTSPGFHTSALYSAPYASKGVNFSDALNKPNSSFYGYGSVVSTIGTRPNTFAVDNSGNVGYVGSSDFPSTSPYSAPPYSFFGDFRNQPQVKAYLEFKKEEWTTWFRYTSLGTSLTLSAFSAGAQVPDSGGNLIDFKGFWDRHVTATVENDHKISDRFSIKNTLSASSEDYAKTENSLFAADLNDVKNFRSKFSESDLLLRSLLVGQISPINRSALGIEILNESWGPGWGSTADQFRMGENDQIVSSPSSGAISSTATPGAANGPVNPASAVYVGSGWNTFTYSVFGETSFEFSRLANIWISARVDKNDYSNYLFSPRIGWVAGFAENSYIKLIWQESQRLNTAEQLLVEHNGGAISSPETLNSTELIYNTAFTKDVYFNASAFYNDIQVLGFNNLTNTTSTAGNLTLAGAEIEGKYSTKSAGLGLSHSFVKQLTWQLGPGQTASGISYSSYNRSVGSGVTVNGVGNDLNNWSNNTTKLFAHHVLTSKLTVFTDMRIFWNFQGAQDGLAAVQNAAAGTSQATTANNDINALNQHGAYQMDFFWDLSGKYNFNNDFSLSLYLMNILGTGKRYSFDNGVAKPFPNRAAFVQEPQAIEAQLAYNW